MTGLHFHPDLLRSNDRELRRRVRRADAAESLVIRTARAGDQELLERLPALDSPAPPPGAGVAPGGDGEARAALEVGSGRFVADPFRPTSGLRELLALRARLSG